MLILTASSASSSYVERRMLLSCLRTYRWVKRSSRLHGPPCLSTDSLCLCIMVSTETPTYSRDRTRRRRSSEMYGANIARVPAAFLSCGPWQGSPFLSICLSSLYMMSATDGSAIKRFTIKWQVHPLLVFGLPAFFFFGTYVVLLGRTMPPFRWSSGPKEHQYLCNQQDNLNK